MRIHHFLAVQTSVATPASARRLPAAAQQRLGTAHAYVGAPACLASPCHLPKRLCPAPPCTGCSCGGPAGFPAVPFGHTAAYGANAGWPDASRCARGGGATRSRLRRRCGRTDVSWHRPNGIVWMRGCRRRVDAASPWHTAPRSISTSRAPLMSPRPLFAKKGNPVRTCAPPPVPCLPPQPRTAGCAAAWKQPRRAGT